MWISFRHVSDLFSVSKDSVAQLREEVAALKAENAAIKSELLSAKVNLDWLRVNYNQVQAERTALVNRQMGLSVPTPQLETPLQAAIRSGTAGNGAYLPAVASQAAISRQIPSFDELSFDDMGDEAAEKLGLPTYGS